MCVWAFGSVFKVTFSNKSLWWHRKLWKLVWLPLPHPEAYSSNAENSSLSAHTSRKDTYIKWGESEFSLCKLYFLIPELLFQIRMLCSFLNIFRKWFLIAQISIILPTHDEMHKENVVTYICCLMHAEYYFFKFKI